MSFVTRLCCKCRHYTKHLIIRKNGFNLFFCKECDLL